MVSNVWAPSRRGHSNQWCDKSDAEQMRNKKLSTLLAVFVTSFWLPSTAPAAESVCYTVQLAAMRSEERALTFLREQQLEDRCRVVPVSGYHTVRCEPELTYARAKRNLESYSKKYPTAWVNAIQQHLVQDSFGLRHAQASCSSQRTVSDTAVLPDTFLDKESVADDSISDILGRVENVRDQYLEELNERGSFKGFYVRSQYDRDTQTDDERELLFLEWELFDEGWIESKKQLDEKRVETKLQFIQLLRDMRERNLHESLFRLESVKNSVRYYEARRRLEVLSKLLVKYEEQLSKGYATQEELQELRYKYEIAQNDVHHYSNLDKGGLSSRDFNIINEIELISLAPLGGLIDKAVENSYDLRIQELFIKRSEFFPRWVDNLSLRLYAGADQGFGDSQRDNVVGVRLRVPIDFKRGRSNLVDIEQSAFQDQKQAISLRLEQKIHRLYQLFQFNQKRIKTAATEYRLMRGYQGLKEKVRMYPVSVLSTVPDKAIDRLSVELLNKEEGILLARLDAFKVLLQLNALVMSNTLSDLIKPDTQSGLVVN